VTVDHPTYPNPTIVEAVCELRFTPDVQGKWESNYFSDFSEKIKGDYPAFEPVQQHAAQFILGAQGIASHAVQVEQRMKFKNADETRLVQIGPSSLAVFFLPKYPGWNFFRSEILSVWGKAVEVIGNQAISRIGLRYINRLPSLKKGESLSNWLKSSDFLPSSVLASKGSTFFRSEVSGEGGSQTVITIGQQEDAAQADKVIYVFDIDCSTTGGIASSAESISQTVSSLHDRAWEVFSASKTPRLDEVLSSAKEVS
jgi:uncharacterized protein (TIGR04255 family)